MRALKLLLLIRKRVHARTDRIHRSSAARSSLESNLFYFILFYV
jgi:hypothetical protein